ncbi:MAG: hypothetical protein DCC67_08915 [Planctomycetota bacterium]|nr:MAG: hypothetical protein DCC67_08915 [Planctomycetota bacterium]
MAPMHARGFNAQDEPQAQEQLEPQAEGDMGEMAAQSEFESYGSCETCPTDCDYGYGDGWLSGMTGGRRVQVVAGAEYLYAQATFSEALAFVEQDPVAGGETFHQIDFDYESSYSFYGGFYLPDCGGSMIFDYTRLTSSGSYAAAESGATNIFGPFEQNGRIEGDADVDLKSYDLAFSKTIPLGCLLGCGTGCGQCCGEGCGGCQGRGWCPAWDITWSGGIRFADVGWSNSISELDPNQSGLPVVGNATTSLDFDGFGGRIGILGRRYLGKRGLFSLYGKGDLSVLFGDVDIETLVTDPGGTAFLRTSNDITVPVTEVELGASAHLNQFATLSAGYFWAGWHDLGMSPTYHFNNAFQITHFDDANILGFNGFFARAEVAF